MKTHHHKPALGKAFCCLEDHAGGRLAIEAKTKTTFMNKMQEMKAKK